MLSNLAKQNYKLNNFYVKIAVNCGVCTPFVKVAYLEYVEYLYTGVLSARPWHATVSSLAASLVVEFPALTNRLSPHIRLYN